MIPVSHPHHSPSERRGLALVAGGAGFLGSHLCETLLEGGWRVLCLDNLQTGHLDNVAHLRRNPRFGFLHHDVCDPLPVAARVSRVFNLACAASPPRYQADPVHTMMTNVAGTRNLLAIAERDGARFLQASTSEVYGDPQRHPQDEDYWGNVNCTGPRACYDEGKRAAEALCFDIQRGGRADVRVARIFNTYGPRMRPEDGRIVSNIVMQALSGKPLTIYGSGEQTRSFCYVSDLVAGLVALSEVEPNPGLPVNLGNPGEFTVNELVDLVVDLVDPAARIVYEALPQDDPRRRRPDIARARSLLGWQPRVALAEGLGPTIAWFRSQVRPARGGPQPGPALRPAGGREPAGVWAMRPEA
jgi:UDP-glucuronate decarboxylase